MNTNTNQTAIRNYKVTFKSHNNYDITLMLWASTGSEDSDRAAVTETATRYAARYGNTLVSVDEITEAAVAYNCRRGMCYSPIDEQAERDHGKSFSAEHNPAEADEVTAEAKCYDLIPSTSQKSFYGKAKVIEINGSKLLQSYNTIVCGIDKSGNFSRYWDGESATTMKHVNSFLALFGIAGGGVNWWRKQAVVQCKLDLV